VIMELGWAVPACPPANLHDHQQRPPLHGAIMEVWWAISAGRPAKFHDRRSPGGLFGLWTEQGPGDKRRRQRHRRARIIEVTIDDLFLAPFTGRDAANCGISREQLRRLRREGALRRMLQGVYASTHLDDDLSVRSAAVSLVLPPGAVLCRRTAAWLRGVDLRLPRRAPVAGRGSGGCEDRAATPPWRDRLPIDIAR